MSTETHVTPDQEFDSELKSRIKTELGEVLDPCSCMSDHPISILDLGLVERIEVDDREVTIDLLLTSQLCTYFLEMADEVVDRVEALDGVDTVEVHQDTSGEVWTQERMAEEERTARRNRLKTRMEEAGLEPYAERAE
ncbi:Metal-sulfur cluster biosynthetic enzyme [Halogranum gelatinilyticum]|uniref:Metal-sulfur cluster biosynthetic enzyme n=1 Tax=Halogranum gelatinilyticum TaxID=660521 RepID=A0A1G9ZST6_9EURY|nr:iron-sulfur cluster assembly protein [Halogranum gelatinilyticum]SDN24244.1 Metal-sulfur cluster biosynthetic enzyme [Halogranum gelatinilyticum]